MPLRQNKISVSGNPNGITYPHAWTVKNLPLEQHKDPFDLLLVAQAKVEGLTLITRDVHLGTYGVQIIVA